MDESSKSSFAQKAQKYLHKKYYTFLAHVVDKKNKEKDIKDIPHVCDYPDVFPKDLPRIPLIRKVKLQIDLIPGATPIIKSLYCLAPSKMQELFNQLQELLDKVFTQPSFSPSEAPILFVKKKDKSFQMCLCY